MIAISALVLVLGGAWWLHGTRASHEPTSTPHLAQLTQHRADALAADLTSGDLARFRQAVAVPSGQAIDPKALTLLTKLKVTLNADTFQSGEGKTATVRGTVAEELGTPTSRLFILIATPDGQWTILDGIEAA